jgi:hypothetical protein
MCNNKFRTFSQSTLSIYTSVLMVCPFSHTHLVLVCPFSHTHLVPCMFFHTSIHTSAIYLGCSLCTSITLVYTVYYTLVYFCITVALGFGKWILNASKALKQIHSTLGSVSSLNNSFKNSEMYYCENMKVRCLKPS